MSWKGCNRLISTPINMTSSSNAAMRIQNPARGIAAEMCGATPAGALTYGGAAGPAPVGGIALAGGTASAGGTAPTPAAGPAVHPAPATVAAGVFEANPLEGGGLFAARRSRDLRMRVYTTAPKPKKPSNL